MATGEIYGKVNIPVKTIKYTGKETDTASVIVDNTEKTIAVDVNVEEVTKDCATKEEIDALSDGLDNLSDRIDDLSDDVVHLTGNEEIGGQKTFTDLFISTGGFSLNYDSFGITASDALYLNGYKEINDTTVFHDHISFSQNGKFTNAHPDNGYGLVIPDTSEYTEDRVIATEEYVSTGLSNKLDKVTTTSDAVRVYAVNTSGTQTTRIVSRNVAEDSLVERATGGVVRCGTPVGNNDAATKKYVDDAVSGISGGTQLYKHIIEIIFPDSSTPSYHYFLEFISDNPANVAGYSSWGNYFYQLVRYTYNGPDFKQIIIGKVISNRLSLFCWESNSLTRYDLSNSVNFITDTVTPL